MLKDLKSMRGLLYKKLIRGSLVKGGAREAGKPEKKYIHRPKDDRSPALQLSGILREEAEGIEILGEEKPKKHEKHKRMRFPRFVLKPQTKLISIAGADLKKPMRYPLIEPYSYVNIRWDPVKEETVYYIVEPQLAEHEKDIFVKIREGLIQTIDVSLAAVRQQGELLRYLEEHVQDLISEYGFRITPQQYFKIMYFIYRDFVGLNRIEPILHDPYVEDIGCDGTSVPIYIVHKRYGSIRTSIEYDDNEELRQFVIKLAERCGRYVSYAEPLLDGALPDGTRVQASLAGDVTTRGPTFSIRKFREAPFTPADLITTGTASPELLAYLWFCVENGINMLICGGVATGKTTFLNAISLFIPEEAKVISIEDTRELSLPHENWIPGVTRVGFGGAGSGEVTMFDLLKASFRQNPDYLIVGEIRGKEAYVMFQGMASGHPSFSTMHAGSVEAVVKRLETPPIELSPGLIETLDMVVVMVHAREKGKSARRLKEIDEIQSIEPGGGNVRYLKSFVWIPSEDSYEYRGNSWVLSKISTQKGLSMSEIIKEINKRKRILEWLVNAGFKDWKEIARYIQLYNKRPEKVLEMAGAA